MKNEKATGVTVSYWASLDTKVLRVRAATASGPVCKEKK